MTLTRYLAGVATVALIVGPLGVASVVARRHWLNGWTGAPARLAEAILLIGLVVSLSEALGTFGLLRSIPLVTGALALGLGTWMLARRSGKPGTAVAARDPHLARHPAWAVPAATLACAAVGLGWTRYVHDAFRLGILDDDTLQYHLPHAARFAQTGSVSRLSFLWLDPVTSFYPSNAEVFHAIGMVAFGRDVLSPMINLGWLSLALLAAWVLGRPFGIGHLTVGMTALVFASPLTAATQAGSALNDTSMLALILASMALLVQADERLGVVALAGLAAGLAVGTKFPAVAPVLALTVALILIRRDRRVSVAIVWITAAAAGGGYWYMRNLVRTGSPVPAVAIPGLPSVRLPSIDAYGRSVSDYITNGHFLTSVVPHGLRDVFGSTYPVVVLLAAAGLVVGIVGLTGAPWRHSAVARAARQRHLTLMLVLTSLVAWAAYVVTPASAYGPPDNPYLFGTSVRYAFPALLASLLLLTVFTVGRRPVWGGALALGTFAILAVELGTRFQGSPSPVSARPRASIGVVILWLAATVIMQRRREFLPRKLPTAAFALAAVALVGLAGFPIAGHYLQHRYTRDRLWAWARTVHHARIAVVGYSKQYPLTGLDLSNRVQYLGNHSGGGRFESYRDCAQFRSALRSGNYQYLLAGNEKWYLEPPRELQWERSDAAAIPILYERRTGVDATLFRINRSLGPSTGPCA